MRYSNSDEDDDEDDLRRIRRKTKSPYGAIFPVEYLDIGVWSEQNTTFSVSTVFLLHPQPKYVTHTHTHVLA